MSSLISIGQIIDSSVDHYRKHGKELLGIALWVLVAFVPLGVVGLITPSDEAVLDALPLGRIALIAAGNLIGVLAVTLVGIWVAVSLILMVAAQHTGASADAKVIGRKAWTMFVPFAVLSLLVAIIAIVPALLTLPGIAMMMIGGLREGAETVGGIGLAIFTIGAVVGVYFLIRLSVELAFAQYRLVLAPKGKLLAGKTLMAAVRESHQLVRGRWFATLWRLAIPNILFSLAAFVINVIITLGAGVLLAVSASSMPTFVLQLGAVVVSFAAVAVNVIIAPLYTIATYALYDSLDATRGSSER